MNALVPVQKPLLRGLELGFFRGQPLLYDGTEPVAIDAQAGKGKLTRFLGVNLVSPRTAHVSKIITDPKDAELAWVSWKTLERQGYRVKFINPGNLYGYPSENFNFNTRLLETAANPALRPLVAGCLRCRELPGPGRPEPGAQMDRSRRAHELRHLQQDHGALSLAALAVQCRRPVGLLRPRARRNR